MSPSRPCEKLAADTLLNRLQRCAPAKPHLYEHDLSDLKPDGESKTGREDGAVYLPKGLHLSNISGITRKKKKKTRELESGTHYPHSRTSVFTILSTPLAKLLASKRRRREIIAVRECSIARLYAPRETCSSQAGIALYDIKSPFDS